MVAWTNRRSVSFLLKSRGAAGTSWGVLPSARDIGSGDRSLKWVDIPHPRYRPVPQNRAPRITRKEVRAPAGSDDTAFMAAFTSTRPLLAIRGGLTQNSPAASPPGRWLLRGLCALFGLYVGWLLFDPGSAKWLYNVLLVGSAFVCLSSPLRRSRERAAWLCLGVTLLLWAAGDFYYTIFLWNQDAAPPTVTDWFWLASYPFLYASIALLVRARTAHFDRSLWLDAILAALAVAAVGATVLFGAVVESTGGSPLLAAMNLAYPLADALLLGIVVAVLALTGWRLDRTWLCIVAGTTVLALTDSAFLYQATSGSSRSRSSTPAGRLRCCCCRPRPGSPSASSGPVRLEGARMLAVPAVFGLTALAILVYGQFEPLNTPAVLLAATSMLAVIARMAFSFREKLRAPLGVADRGPHGPADRHRQPAQADRRPEREAERPDACGPDPARPGRVQGLQRRFGHPAGDALLARLAKKLAAAVARDGDVYRIGGDEFCVLGTVEPARREAFAPQRPRRCRSTARDSGSRQRKAPLRCPRRRMTSPRRSGSWTAACTTRRTGAVRPPAGRAATCSCARSTSGTSACRAASPTSSSSCGRSGSSSASPGRGRRSRTGC